MPDLCAATSMAHSVGLPMNCGLSPSKCTSAVEFTQKPRISAPSRGSSEGSRCVSPSCTSVTVIRFSVSVPVLSEQMTLMQPTVSHATSFFTSAFCLDIFMMFMASVTATIVGRPSGTAATISTILSRKASENSPNICVAFMFANSSEGSGEPKPRMSNSTTCTRNITAAATEPTMVMSLPSLPSFSCNGVLDLS